MRQILAVAALAACVHAPARRPAFQATPEQQNACASARAAYLTALRSASCSNDWDCEPVPAYETGKCGVATSAQAIEAAKPLRQPVVAACHVIPELVEPCHPFVGVCEKGVCGLRLEHPSQAACEVARKELDEARQAVTADSCAADEDCTYDSVDPTRAVSRRALADAARKAEHDAADACGPGQPPLAPTRKKPPGSDKPRWRVCRQARCVLAETGFKPPDGGNCVRRALGDVIPDSAIGANVKVLAKFHVGKDGIPYDFSFLTPTRSDLALRFVLAIRSCTFEPGRNESGEPIDMLFILPIRLESGW